MRLHDLEITAFGPFAETVRVDLDALSAGGLFLLTGDTGAGKTSVLDAVCFALYGEVPGDRHAAKHLRSDHAAEDTAPEVVLRTSIGARTFRFTRSPAWDRPKRRGMGTTRVQAHVVVEELVEHEWRTLTNRLDEAGHLVTSLLSMTCSQFTQVAMLPQGRFQAFLRATSAERQAVLQRLFRTRRFEDVERWLAERRVVLGRESREQHDRAATVVSRVLEATSSELPEGWELDDLGPVCDGGLLRTWSTDLATAARSGLDAAADLLDRTSQDLAEKREGLHDAEATEAARRRGRRATQVLEELAQDEEAEQLRRDALEAHHRAAPVRALARHADEAAAAASAAHETAAEHAAAAARLMRTFPETLQVSAVDVASRVLRQERGVAESWLPRERELIALRERHAVVAADATSLAAQVSEVDLATTELTSRREILLVEIDALRRLAARHDADRAAHDLAVAGRAAAVEADDVTVRLEDARRLVREATEESQSLREVYQDLRESRISGMAAELAVGLAVGGSCPVCGSHEHPAPAQAHQRVSRADEDVARVAWETAAFGLQAAQESVRTLETALGTLQARTLGRGTDEWDTDVRERASALAESATARQQLDLRETELGDTERALAEAGVSAAALTATLEERRRELHDVAARVRRLESDLRRLLAAHPGVSGVAALVEELDRVLDVLDRARDALARREQADREARRSGSAAAAAAAEAGFDTLAEAVAAVLEPREAEQHAAFLAERASARAAAAGVLAEADVRAALEAEPVDVAPLAEAVATASSARDAASAAHRQAEVRVTRLDVLLGQLDEVLTTWEPVRRDHAVAASLASLVEGRSADNALRMRLSAYVLSERLRQVVAAANERLGAMTDERYTLAQVDEKGAGELRGGLSLRVRDEWSGRERDPATLSGGETFLVSLALALGLADTVSHEAGGTQLDTLFVDEGFGALDATTLDGVMDVLDGLRDGGRVVGLVSHVAELRDRVTTRLEVRKARRGSTLTPVLVGDSV